MRKLVVLVIDTGKRNSGPIWPKSCWETLLDSGRVKVLVEQPLQKEGK